MSNPRRSTNSLPNRFMLSERKIIRKILQQRWTKSLSQSIIASRKLFSFGKTKSSKKILLIKEIQIISELSNMISGRTINESSMTSQTKRNRVQIQCSSLQKSVARSTFPRSIRMQQGLWMESVLSHQRTLFLSDTRILSNIQPQDLSYLFPGKMTAAGSKMVI